MRLSPLEFDLLIAIAKLHNLFCNKNRENELLRGHKDKSEIFIILAKLVLRTKSKRLSEKDKKLAREFQKELKGIFTTAGAAYD